MNSATPEMGGVLSDHAQPIPLLLIQTQAIASRSGYQEAPTQAALQST